jgi:hypothetical protein
VRYAAIIGLLGTIVVLAGCGGSKSAAPATSTSASPVTTVAPTTTSTGQTSTSPSALQAEANSAAAGDIPDNQVFIAFKDGGAGYSMKYPEGWAQQGSGGVVTFRDKNNIARIVVRNGALPGRAAVEQDVNSLPGATIAKAPAQTTIGGAPAWKVTYQTQSAANTVTGKRVTLVVDRYYLARGGKEAIVDLGAPKGVDNVDAYRLMIQSFRWR